VLSKWLSSNQILSSSPPLISNTKCSYRVCLSIFPVFCWSPLFILIGQQMKEGLFLKFIYPLISALLKKNKLYNFSKLLSCVVFNVSINGKMSEIKFLRTILWCAYVILITFQSTHKLYYFNLFGNEYLLKKKFKLYLLTHFLSDRMC
jgi:hypothetical protein